MLFRTVRCAQDHAIALIAALTVLPPLIVWADKWNLVSKGMLDRPKAPFIEVADHKAGVE